MSLSRANIQALRSLSQKKHRLASGNMLIEGGRLVLAALESPAVVSRFLHTEAFSDSPLWQPILEAASQRGLTPERITPVQAEQLGETRSPQGCFAVVGLPGAIQAPLKPPLLIIDHVSDPGNLGSLLRTADWFGMPSVWISADSADTANPKVVRGGMGAHFHLPNIYQGDLAALPDQLKRAGIVMLGAVLEGDPTHESPPDAAWALVVGNEARGLSPFWREKLDQTLTIPGGGAAESLNVTVATGILLHQLFTTARK